jgi:hypothetical protein
MLYHLASLGFAASISPSTRIWVYSAMLATIAVNSGLPGAFIYFQF